MASLINSPMLDETGKAIVAAITGEEPSESATPVSQIKAPMSEATAQALLEAIQNMPKLPAAAAADAGKIVSVDENGGYVLGEAGGGNQDVEYVNLTSDSSGGPTVWRADKTYAEISDLINSGKNVYFKNANLGCTLAPVQKHASGALFATFFNRAEVFSTPKTVVFDTFSISSANAITRTQSTVSAT